MFVRLVSGEPSDESSQPVDAYQLYAFSMNAFKQEVVGGDCAEAIGVAGLLFDFCRCVF